MNNSYTLSTSPAAQEKIEADLKVILREIETHCSTEAVVLGGSFGRGEGSVKEAPGAEAFPLNDYDIWVITRETESHTNFPAIAAAIKNQIGIDFVDLTNITSSSLSRLPCKQVFYDLRYGASIISGDAEILKKIPAYSNKQILKEDAILLLCNRLAGILGAFDSEHILNKSSLSDYQKNQLIHMGIACGDAILIMKESYHSSYREKLNALKALFSDVSFLDTSAQKILTDAYQEKLYPNSVPVGHARIADLLNVLAVAEKCLCWCSYCIGQHEYCDKMTLSWEETFPTYHKKNGPNTTGEMG